MVTFKTSDGKEGTGFLLRNKIKTDNYVFVFQEWWGLNDYIKKESERIFNELGNVNVIALDMYDGVVATTREQASGLMSSAKEERLTAIINGATDFAGKKAKIATIGWCFGGGLSLKAGLLLGSKAKACVMYYGMPETDVEKLKPLKADVLGIFANREKWITPEVVNKFESSMKLAKKKLILKQYDAEHGFANPSNPIYNKEAAADAGKIAIAFIKERLK
jgi:carboxymethylenebutenolidase